MITALKVRVGALAFADTIGLAAPAAAEEISVSHWAVTMVGEYQRNRAKYLRDA